MRGCAFSSTFSISAIWVDIDWNGGDGFGAHVVVDGSSIYDANPPNGGSTSFTTTLPLISGGVVDFVVDPGVAGDQNFDATSLNIAIQSGTPSPTPTPTPTVRVTVKTNPAGVTFTVGGNNYTAAQRFSWVSGSSHTIAPTSPQSGGTGIQYVWTRWSDNGAISHAVAPTTNTAYTAKFKTQYYL